MAEGGNGASSRSRRNHYGEPQKAQHGTREIEQPEDANEAFSPDHSRGTVAQGSTDLERDSWTLVQESVGPSTTGEPHHPAALQFVQMNHCQEVHVGPVIHYHYCQHGIDGGRTVTPETHGDPPMPTTRESPGAGTRIKKKSDLYRSYCQRKTHNSFVETAQSIQARECIQTEEALVIIGDSGYGKTSILHHIAAQHMQGFIPIPCKTIEDINQYLDCVLDLYLKLLFVIDEPFGGSFVDQNLVKNWINMGGCLEMYLGTHKFLFATRTNVWADCAVHFDKSPFFVNRVKVTSASLTSEDREKLLRKYLTDSGKLTDSEVKAIVSIKNPIAYCECCKLMRDAIKRGQTGEALVEIFIRPFFHLSTELRQMKDQEKFKYVALCSIMLCGGKIECKELSGTWSDVTPRIREIIGVVCDTYGCNDIACGNLLECVHKLTDTFVEQISETGENFRTSEVYVFTHDSIHEAVIMEYANHHIRQCFKYLHSDIIVKVARPRDYKKKENEFVVSFPVDADSELAQVFTEAAIDGNWRLHDVFQNPCVRVENFQHIWCEYLNSRSDKLAAFIQSKSWDGRCIYHLSDLAGALTLWRFLKDVGVTCTCRISDSSQLAEAASLDDTVTVKNIMRSNTPSNDEVCQAIISACEHGCGNVLKMLPHVPNCKRHTDTIAEGMKLACLNGRHNIVEYLLNTFYSPCKGEKCGCMRGLRWAAWAGQTDTVLVLLSHGSGINIRGNDGGTCLHRAAQSGKIETVRELLNNNADINITDNDGWTCLHLAADGGHIDTASELITRSADPNLKNNYGQTCFHLAAYRGHIETLRVLMDHGAKINMRDEDGQTCLHLATQSGQIKMVRELIAHGAKVNLKNNFGQTCLDWAAYRGCTETVKYLLDQEADTNITDSDGWTCLHWAANNEHTGTVECLVGNGAGVNARTNDGQTCLHRAVYNGHVDVVDHLLTQRVDINATDNYGQTCLHWAAGNGHIDILNYLFTRGATLNVSDEQGWSILHWAANNGHTKTVEYLVTHGAELNSTDNNGQTSLHWAAGNGHTDTVARLVHHGDDVNFTDNDGWTSLHWAACDGHIATVQYLVNHGARVDIADNIKRSCLHWAAHEGHTETVEFLIAREAKTNMKDKWNKSALDLAEQRGHSKIGKMLAGYVISPPSKQ